ncbi:MAG TPA: hypothetical protein VFP88_03435 [Rhodanobacteraceae bacterium]|nr:hypothetical protein [Rhodanobacteraceae bacterium]
MKILIAMVLAALVVPPAMAQSARTSVPTPASSSLNLQLPPSQNMPGAVDSGDKGGKPSNTTVHGSVSTAVGYAKGYGTGIATGVSLDVEHQTDNGAELGLHIHAVQSNGFPVYGYGAYGYGAYGYGAYGYRPHRHYRGWGGSPAPVSSSSDGD